MVDNLLDVSSSYMYSDVTHWVDVLMGPENGILQVSSIIQVFFYTIVSIEYGVHAFPLVIEQ